VRVTDSGDADSMLQFQLEGIDDGTKCYQKMKWMHRAHLGSMERKCNMVLRCGTVGRRRGDTGERKERR
jgi:hypothetical protein